MSTKRIAIVGAGPIGLEAALYARMLGHQVAVFDRGEVAENIGHWGFLDLFTPWRLNTTPLGRSVAGKDADFDSERCPTGRELRARYLLPLADSPPLRGHVFTRARVVSIEQNGPYHLTLADDAGRECRHEADVVLDCSGTFGQHRWAGPLGQPAIGEAAAMHRIWYLLPDIANADRHRFAGRTTLVVGAGHSAATAIAQLGRLAETDPTTRVNWVMRRWGQLLQVADQDPFPRRRMLLQSVLHLATNRPPWLCLLDDAIVEEIYTGWHRRLYAAVRSSHQTLHLPVDEILALVGYQPDASILRPLPLYAHFIRHGAARTASGLLGGPGHAASPQPGFFILGAKSYGTNSAFLVHVGHAQVRDAFRLIHGDPQLDLYGRT